MAILDAFEIETNDRPAASIIWLHGLGSNGYDFEPIIPELNLPSHLAIRFIFPHALKRALTINGGLKMPSWYDFYAHDIDRKVDTKQLTASANDVAKFIHREIENGIASERIIIAGFSQGGAVGYQLALSYPQKLGGLIALSTYFATKKTIEYHPANDKLPIFIGHGSDDSIVPELLGQQACTILKEKKYTVDYHSYSMEHSVCMQEVKAISRWIQIRLL
ncbi:MAG: phospholipase/carboxylesterase [Cellvibrionaceae bacterium]|jgi:phospholipase/carboxylesterase